MGCLWGVEWKFVYLAQTQSWKERKGTPTGVDKASKCKRKFCRIKCSLRRPGPVYAGLWAGAVFLAAWRPALPPEVSGLAEEVGRWAREGSAAAGAGGTKSQDRFLVPPYGWAQCKMADGHFIMGTVLSYHMRKQGTVKGNPLHQANACPTAVTHAPGDNSVSPLQVPFGT